MGFLDDVKGKLGDLGEKAGDAFEAAKDKASDVVEDVKDKLDVNNDGQVTGSEVFEAVKDRVTGHDSAEGVTPPTGTSPDIAPTDEAGASATPAGETLTTPVEPAADPLHPMVDQEPTVPGVSEIHESTSGGDAKY